jgi:monofunctional biosynthetic peptidoglycan transglycosylase
MATKAKPKAKKKKGGNKFRRITKRLFLIILISHLVYILFCWVFFPPITITQTVSLVTGHGLSRDYVSLDEISPYARLAVIASEDQRYLEHDGIDWESMEKAREYNKTHKKQRGGSTISQQTAKNVFLWQHGGYFRKGLELYFTFITETLYSKRRIMELYLNVIEMGDGIFGIEAASQKYFGHSAKTLTKQEAAMIAACLPNPKTWSVKPMSKIVARRYPKIMKQMSFLAPLPEVKELMK